MVKKLTKYIGLSLLLIAIGLIIIDQTRSFYCLERGKCITVWKQLGNKCYIIPGKYYGLFKPDNAYIKTTNTNLITVIWQNNHSILIDSYVKVEIFNQFSGSVVIRLYNNEKILNDSLYTYFDGNYHKYKKGVNYMSVDIEENLVVGNGVVQNR